MITDEDRWMAREKELIAMVGQLEHDNAVAAETIEDLRHYIDTLEGKMEQQREEIEELWERLDWSL